MKAAPNRSFGLNNQGGGDRAGRKVTALAGDR